MMAPVRNKIRKARGRACPGASQWVGLRRTAFTLVEIMIVVVILGILAAMVVPKLSNASQTAREGTLKDEVRYMRTQIAVYTAGHHDVPPGYPSGDKTHTPTDTTFIAQLTQHTDEYGNLGADGTGVYTFGPYLTQMPANSVNSRTDIIIAADGPITPDGNSGWLYQPTTGTIMPNLTGSDSQGIPYKQY